MNTWWRARAPTSGDAREKLIARLERESIPEPNSGCVLWIGFLSGSGYGRTWNGHRRISAHRAAYELAKGPIPEGLQLDHLCRQRSCINPAHLEPVTPLENWRRGTSPSAQNAAKTVCDSGHPLTEDNLRRHRGHRRCKTCMTERSREHYERNRAAVIERSRQAKIRARWLKLASQLNLSAAPLSNPPSSDVSDAGRPSVSEFSGGGR